MGEEIEEDVERPCQHFPERLAPDHPYDAKDCEENHEAMGDIVEIAHVCRYFEKIRLPGSDGPGTGHYRRIQPLKKQDAE